MAAAMTLTLTLTPRPAIMEPYRAVRRVAFHARGQERRLTW